MFVDGSVARNNSPIYKKIAAELNLPGRTAFNSVYLAAKRSWEKSQKSESRKMQGEWSDTLNEIIWDFSRCPCAWMIGTHKKSGNEILVFGSCRSVHCDAKLFVYTENNRFILNIVIKGFKSEVKHSEKRATKNANKA